MEQEPCAAAAEEEKSDGRGQQAKRSVDQRRHRDADGECCDRGQDALLGQYRLHGRLLLPAALASAASASNVPLWPTPQGCQFVRKIAQPRLAGTLWKYMYCQEAVERLARRPRRIGAVRASTTLFSGTAFPLP